MKTTRNTAEEKINQLLDESFRGARVMQGGGNEVLGNNLQEMILEAADNSLARLYPISRSATSWAGTRSTRRRAREHRTR